MPAYISGMIPITSVQATNGRVHASFKLVLADVSQPLIAAHGMMYLKPQFQHHTPTENAIHYVHARFGFENSAMVLDTFRCVGPYLDKHKVPVEVEAIGDVLTNNGSTVTMKVGLLINILSYDDCSTVFGWFI